MEGQKLGRGIAPEETIDSLRTALKMSGNRCIELKEENARLRQEVEARCIEFAAARNTALANLNHKDKEIASLLNGVKVLENEVERLQIELRWQEELNDAQSE